jgi:hypothetical protein
MYSESGAKVAASAMRSPSVVGANATSSVQVAPIASVAPVQVSRVTGKSPMSPSSFRSSDAAVPGPVFSNEIVWADARVPIGSGAEVDVCGRRDELRTQTEADEHVVGWHVAVPAARHDVELAIGVDVGELGTLLKARQRVIPTAITGREA